MRYPIHRLSLSATATVAIITGIAAAVVMLLAYSSPSIANHACTGTNIVEINPGDDLDAIVNDPIFETTPQTFCVHSGEYTIDETVRLRSGDQLLGQPGTYTTLKPKTIGATKPTPTVIVTPGTNVVHRLIRADGTNIKVRWLDLSGATGEYSVDNQPVAGTGAAISAGTTDGTFVARYLRVHNNDGAGITNTRGRVYDSEFFKNTEDPNFAGFIGSAIKGITEFEAARNFVHDEQANGIWLDLGRDDPTRLNGYWVHHNVVVNTFRAGIRYENSPPGLPDGVHQTEVTALIEKNSLHANSLKQPDMPRPISVHNSQNATVHANVFGEATINGVFYPHNGFNVAIRAADVRQPDRTDTWNVDITNNVLNGEKIVISTRRGQTLTCGQVPAEKVSCANNSP